MGLFTMGFLKGAADRYVKVKEQESKAAAEQEKYEREQKAALEQYNREQADKHTFQLMKADDELHKQEEKIRLEDELKTGRREQDIINTFGYVTDPETGQQRIPTGQEMSQQLINAAQAGNPIIVPPSLGTVYGFKEALEGAGGGAGTQPTAMTGEGTMFDMMISSPMIGGKPLPVFGVSMKSGGEQEFAKINMNRMHAAILPKLDEIYREAETTGDFSVLEGLAADFGNFGGSAWRLANRTGGKESEGEIIFDNPASMYGANKFITNPRAKEWYIKNVYAPLIGKSEKEARQYLGLRPHDSLTPVGRTENGDIILKAKANTELDWLYSGETRDDGKPAFDPVIEPFIKDLRDKTNLKTEDDVVNMMSKFAENKEQAIKFASQLVKDSVTLPAQLLTPSGKLNLTPATFEIVQSRVEGIKDPNAGIAYLYAIMPEDKLAGTPATISSSAISSPFDYRMKSRQANYNGMDGVKAETAAVTARQVRQTAEQLLEISNGPAQDKVRALVNNLKGMAEATFALVDFAMVPDSVADGLNERRDAINASLSKSADELMLDEEGVKNLLQNVLTFKMIAYIQNGASGKDVAQKEIENFANGLGFKGFASKDVTKTTLSYIIGDFTRKEAIYSNMAAAQDDEALFKAAYLYGQAVNPSVAETVAIANSKAGRDGGGTPPPPAEVGATTKLIDVGGGKLVPVAEIPTQQ